MNRLTHHRSTRYAITISLAFALVSVAFVTARMASSNDQDVKKLNRFVQSSQSNTPAMKMFREGRDLIEAENWQQAADTFRGFTRQYPRDRDMDAALYWYAYALQKMGRKEDAKEPLKRLIKAYPGSSWRREADAMLVSLGEQKAVDDAINNDNCEIKILALQSLFQANEERAMSYVNDVMKSNSESCPGLKVAAVSFVGSYGGPSSVPFLLDVARAQTDLKLRLTAIKRLGEQNNDAIADELIKLYDADKTKEIRIQILRAFAEMHTPHAEAKLIEVARSGDDPALRQYAIRYLGQLKTGASLDELFRIFDADKTPAVRSQILRAIAERDDPRAHAKLLEIARTGETPELRIEAIRMLAGQSPTAMDDLIQLYTSEANVAIKQGLIKAYGDMRDPRAATKLFEIARTGEPIELRALAIRQLGNRNDEQTTDQLVAMYDSEQNLQVKMVLLRAFGDSPQKSAVRKLMTIAREGQSVDLRKMAVRMLGESKDPEALKFLEDLLK